MLVAVLVSAACVAVYPLFTVLTGNSVTLKPGWPALVLGLWLINGMAEELAWLFVIGLALVVPMLVFPIDWALARASRPAPTAPEVAA
jgi:hypothetical protein